MKITADALYQFMQNAIKSLDPKEGAINYQEFVLDVDGEPLLDETKYRVLDEMLRNNDLYPCITVGRDGCCDFGVDDVAMAVDSVLLAINKGFKIETRQCGVHGDKFLAFGARPGIMDIILEVTE